MSPCNYRGVNRVNFVCPERKREPSSDGCQKFLLLLWMVSQDSNWGDRKKSKIWEEKCFWHILENFFLDLLTFSDVLYRFSQQALGQGISSSQASVDPYVKVRGWIRILSELLTLFISKMPWSWNACSSFPPKRNNQGTRKAMPIGNANNLFFILILTSLLTCQAQVYRN